MPNLAQQQAFLRQAFCACVVGKHIWPDYAACEAAEETGYGTSRIFKGTRNLWNQKQGRIVTLPYPTFDTLTGEIVEGRPASERASFLVFPDWPTAARERMALLQRLPRYYGAALRALTGEQFVREIGGYRDDKGRWITRWASDPTRAEKVLAIHRQHAAFLAHLKGETNGGVASLVINAWCPGRCKVKSKHLPIEGRPGEIRCVDCGHEHKNEGPKKEGN